MTKLASKMIEEVINGKDPRSAILLEDRAAIEHLVKKVEGSIADYKYVSRFTTFSQWYKGDHGRAYQAMKKSYADLIKALKSSTDPSDEALLRVAKDSYDEVSTKSGEGWNFPEAVKKWRQNEL